MKLKPILEIRDERGVVIQPYLPENYCPTPGHFVGEELHYGECLISVENCEACYIESARPSPTGQAYYTTH